MHMQYNTPAYRRHYKSMVERYDACDKAECIEPRVRQFSQIVRESGLGVSIWSCEGHIEESYVPLAGYVMFTARNREAATKLIEVFQRTSARIVDELGWGALPDIETTLASLEEDTSYPCIVIRNPSFEEVELADRFWEIVTHCVYNQLKHHMVVNPENREAVA